jgi:hypothetical protein
MGFAAFHTPPSPSPLERQAVRSVGGENVVLAARFIPLEEFLDRSRTTSPWPLPPCRSRPRWPDPPVHAVADVNLGAPPARSVDFGALLRRRVRTRDRTLPLGTASCPSLGFVPLRGPVSRPTSLSIRRVGRRTSRWSEENREAYDELRPAPATIRT